MDEIHATALRLIDAGGAEALSMRKLAAELDVNPMSLYHHVENKTALLAGVCGLAISQLRLPPDDGRPWQEQLRALAHAYRSLAQAHPRLWAYVHEHPEVVDRKEGMGAVLRRILHAAGVPERDVEATSEILYAFVTGFVYAETRDHLGEHPGAEDVDRSYEIAIRLILAGLASGEAFDTQP
ncbi:TetR/AcrR family transcriptional regulator [Thermocatellispora tengchongensis]|uniref:TetR/AcrR family transcriptional regulator n=1 Tax=Thermocatellispora tengchongensis TaxID=1073253 RepID=UPI00362FB2E3